MPARGRGRREGAERQRKLNEKSKTEKMQRTFEEKNVGPRCMMRGEMRGTGEGNGGD